MDERIRVSDADREEVAERLREHFAQGRLGTEELEERIAAALTAKTVGDLRRVQADLPDPAAVPASSGSASSGAGRSWLAGPGAARSPRGRWAGPVRWRPHPLPLLLIAMVAAVLLPGAGALLVIVKFVLLLWLLAIVAAVAAMVRLGRRAHRHWHEAQRQWSQAQGAWSQAQWSQAPWSQAQWSQAQWWREQDWHGRHWHAAYWHHAHRQGRRHGHHWQGDYSS